MEYDFIAAADLHLTDSAPNKRKGDYLSQVLDKFEQILIITKNKTHSNLLLVAGDFFDSATTSYHVTREIIKIIKKHNVTIIVIPGQHDLRYHQSGLKNTPLGVLVESGFVFTDNNSEFSISFSGWNEEPKEKTDVLLTHRMVIKKEKIFFEQKDFISAKDLLKKYPWAKIIISGDNHTPHVLKYKNRIQLNCGSMVRKTKEQVDYKPAVWGIKLEPELIVKRIPLKILHPDEVFDFHKIEKEEELQTIKKEAEEKINNFIKVLPEMDQNKPKFPLILQSIVKETNPGKKVERIINNIMEKVS